MKFEEKVKIIVVGEPKVGKTCLIHSYVNDEFPTGEILGETYNVTMNYNGNDLHLELHECNLIKEDIQIDKADIFLVCFSLIDKESLIQSYSKWLYEINAPKDSIRILVGLKADIREEYNKNE